MRRAARVTTAIVAAWLACGSFAAAGAVKIRPVTQIYQDALGVGLRTPEGVGCHATGIAVADSGNGRVVLYEIRDDLLVARAALALPELAVPIRVALRPDGGLLVLDGKSRRIGRVTAEGKFEGWLEPAASGTVTPRAIAVGPEGEIVVLDVSVPRVLVLDGDGRLKRQIALPPGARSPSDVAIDARGNVLVVDGLAAALYGATAGAAAATVLAEWPRTELELAHAVAVDPLGRLFVVDRSGGRIAVLRRDGSGREMLLSPGWKPGELRYPGAICIDGRGFIYVADRENSRVQVFAIAE